MSIVYTPVNGAVYRKVASGARVPPKPHDAPPVRLGVGMPLGEAIVILNELVQESQASV